jgi:hypothetical protein
VSSKNGAKKALSAARIDVAASMNAGAKVLRKLTRAYNAATAKAAARRGREARSSASSGSPAAREAT